ncbi:MAG: oligosaccharide flippase family protein [candidate division WOR-3 bacterium]
MKNSGSVKELFKETIIYGIGLFLKRAIGFFLIPLYTHTFTQKEYGKIAMIYLLSSILILLFTLGLNDALLKQITEKNAEENEVFTRFFIFRLIYTSIFLLLLIIYSEQVAIFLMEPDEGYLISLAILTIWIETLFEPALLILRIKNQSKKFVTINTLRFLSNIVFNILFVLKLKLGIGGVLLGNLLSSSIFFFILYPEIHSRFTLKIKWTKIKNLLSYGLPLLPLSFIIWIGLELIDRWIIKLILGLSEAGIYTLGYQFGTVMGIIVHGFRASWTPFFFKNPRKKEAFANSAITFVRLSLFLWAILSFFTPEIFKIMVAKEYWEAQSIVPIIALSYIFFGLEEIFTAPFYIKSRTGLLVPIALTPLLVNIALNLYLIPFWGIMGASFATLFSYFLFALFSYLVGNKLLPVNYNLKIILSDLCLGIALLCLTTLFGNALYQRLLAFIILCSVLCYKEKTKIKILLQKILKASKS